MPATGPTTKAPRRVRWTREQYHRLGEQGYFDGMRVELIDGEVYEMSPIHWPHALAKSVTCRLLDRLFEPTHWVNDGNPLPAGGSEPQPDLAVFPGMPRDYADHPVGPVLVVEISDSTLRLDLGRKARMYARAGVPDYWVVDLNGRRLVVHRSPGPGGYADVTALPAGAAVEPLARPGVPVAVNDLLP